MGVFKKVLRGAGLALAGVLGLGCLAAAYVEIDGIPRYDHEAPALHVEVTPERVARGAKLASMLCADCHEDATTHRFTGRHMGDIPREFGDVYSRNITRDPDKGIGRWTDGDIVYFLRTGIRPDGQYVPPWMIKLPHLSDEDAASVVAFLRSDDPRVAPAHVDPPGVTEPSFLGKVLVHGPIRPLPYPTEPVVAPPTSDRVAYGRYLAFNLDCWTCHSGTLQKLDPMHPEETPGFFGGGIAMKGADGKEVRAANLTPDDATGIGRWTEAEFTRALREGFRPDGHVLRSPMTPKAELDDDEAGAIYAYLRTVPPIRNDVPRGFGAAAAPDAPPGARLYASYGCVGCHGATGAGSDGAADLRAANEHYPDDDALRAWIEDAPSKRPGTRMPRWKGVIRDEDWAPLMAYVRTLARPAGRAASNP